MGRGDLVFFAPAKSFEEEEIFIRMPIRRVPGKERISN
jgi:hypothetical protein